MIITKTPFRMSFFGGGTDMEKYFREFGGSVISTTIDKYCYVTVRNLPHFFDYSTELAYSKIERVDNVNEIKHPAIRNAMQMTNINNIRLTYEADLPARSGLGTSSSFSVGMLKAFYTLKGLPLSKKENADKAIYLERVLCEEAGGWQDQIAAAYGGFNRIDFKKNGSYYVTSLPVPSRKKKALSRNLCLVFTGISRFSSEIQEQNHPENKTKLLNELSLLTHEAENILTSRKDDIDDFGKLLDETWMIKRETGASTSHIDELYECGKKAGALGGKILGAGGGGFFIFYIKPENRKKLIESLKGTIIVPFVFEEDGVQVIFDTARKGV